MGLFSGGGDEALPIVEDLVENAEGSTVTSDALTGSHLDANVLHHLRERERPHHVLIAGTRDLRINDRGEKRSVPSSGDRATVTVLTDQRILFLVGQRSGDERWSVEYTTVHDFSVDSGLLANRLTVSSRYERYTAYFPVTVDTEALSSFLARNAGRPPGTPTGGSGAPMRSVTAELESPVDETGSQPSGEPPPRSAGDEFATHYGALTEKYGSAAGHLLVGASTAWWTLGLGNVLYAAWKNHRYRYPDSGHDPDEFEATASKNWYYGVLGGLAVFGLSLSFGTIGFATVVAWILLPLSMYYDIQNVRATTDWNPITAWWVLGGVLFAVNVVVAPLYLAKRYFATDAPGPGETAVSRPESE